MSQQLKRILSFALSVVLCTSTLPAASIAEELAVTNATDGDAFTLIYRLHAMGADALADEDPWFAYDAASNTASEFVSATDEVVALGAAEANDDAATAIGEGTASGDSTATGDAAITTLDASAEDETSLAGASAVAAGPAIDAVAIKASDGTQGIEYRVRDKSGAWAQGWTADGAQALSAEGISGIQVRMSEGLSASYDVWYRARTASGSWLGWAKNGEDSGSDVNAIVDVQIALVKKGADAPSGTDAAAFEEVPLASAGSASAGSATGGDAAGGNLQTEEAIEDGSTSEADIAVTTSESSQSQSASSASTDAAITTQSSDTQSSGTQSKSTSASKNSTGAKLTVAESTTTTAAAPKVTYQSYMKKLGKMSVLSNGKTSGVSVTGSQVPMKAFRVKVSGLDGNIVYKACMSNSKWTGWRKNWKYAGTTKGSKTLKAVRIKLTGNAKDAYDVYYRVYVRKIGWMGWAKNGEAAGTTSFTYQTGAIQIVLKAKGEAAPTNDGATTASYLGTTDVSYNACYVNGSWTATKKNGKVCGNKKGSAYLQTFTASVSGTTTGNILYASQSNGGSWSSYAKNGAIAGTEGKNLTAIRFKLSGKLKKYYNVWYRAYVAGKGWTGWGKNSAAVGSDTSSYGIRAIQVKVLSKTTKAPGKTSNTFYTFKQLNGVDISGWEAGINTKTLTADFVIVKATEGVQGTIYNPGYKTMANNAYNSGKLIGFYHYANGGNAKKEAQCFYKAIKSYKGKAIACLDWEGQGNSKFATGVDVKWCKTFLDELKRLYGGTPLFYTGKNETNSYNWSSVAKSYPLWGAEYAYADYIYQGYQSNPWQSSNKWGAWGTKALIHQYGYVNPKPNNGGISTGLDGDLFYGTTSDWNALLS